MASKKKAKAAKRVPKNGGALPVLCNVFGTILLTGVIVLCLPLAAPRLLGYQVYDVLSGSMEPEIPTGSVVYTTPVDPADVQVDEIIAFVNADGNVVVHRVLNNRTSLGEFVTKGDANNVEDREPAPYDALQGRVVLSVPIVGHFMALYASNVGKVYLLLTAGCGVMFNMLAERIREDRHRRALLQQAAEAASGGQVTVPAYTGWGLGWVRVTLMLVLSAIFVGSGGVIGYVTHQHRVSDASYEKAVERYTKPSETKSVGPIAPIVVDFDELRAVNPDVVGWIYCEGTNINYPVLHGKTNDDYLRHEYTGEYNIDGSIFVDAGNKGDFSDAHTIIYGHNMYLTESMFYLLDSWQEQSFYDAHPTMWLLTPERDYQVVLVAGHHANAYSDYYEPLSEHNEKFTSMLAQAVEDSDFVTGVPIDYRANYVMLTTCAYIFQNARYVLHGQLVPAGSAGGVPIG